MQVAVRTRIRRGRRARSNAVLAIVLAAFFFLVSLVLIYASYSLSRTAAALSHPNKQIQPTPKNGAADLQHWTDR
jgi:hypothetical protein